MPSASALFGSLMFGIIGFAAFMYGKKSALFMPMILGVALMVYPYFISETWLLYLIGTALSVALFFFRS
ncbi:MAG: hypothetical protein ABI612_17630 [Betaproteobacteria bacterium]